MNGTGAPCGMGFTGLSDLGGSLGGRCGGGFGSWRSTSKVQITSDQHHFR